MDVRGSSSRKCLQLVELDFMGRHQHKKTIGLADGDGVTDKPGIC